MSSGKRLAAFAIACGLIVSCTVNDRLTTPVSSTTATAARPGVDSLPGVNKDVIYDWYSCTSTDYGTTFSCVYTGSTGHEYLFLYNDYPTRIIWSTTDCSVDQCPSSGSGYRGLSAADPNDNVDLDSANGEPDCNTTQTQPGRIAYCHGFAPTGARLSRINSALSAMKAITSDTMCAHLAYMGDTVLAQGHLKLYNNPPGQPYGGGWAPPNGGASGANSWMAIDVAWVDIFYNSSHKAGGVGNRYLQQLLAHELDHLANFGHTTDDAITTHSQICS